MSARSYKIVQGFFIQDEGYEGMIPPHFGLLDTSDYRWSNTIGRITELNESAPQGVAYKLIIAGRHGQGFHNLAELKYGSKLWNEHWAKLDTDGEIVWGPDPLLTELGEDQARVANAILIDEVAAGAPLPDGLYCSPMTRAIQTCCFTFAKVVDFADRPPLILENAREIYGVHSCDKRRSKSYIMEEFPEFKIEDSFTEEDELHDPNVRETYEHVAQRGRNVLDHIFNNDNGTVISVTAHSAFIRGFLISANHKPVPLPTGGIVPMVVKSTIALQ